MIDALERLARRQLPRMLTQVCRDPGSPYLGAWDRNWWHYKIRDFSSIILQQGGYVLHIASQLPIGESIGEAKLRSWAASSALFWNQRALRHGSFEEYYPYEQGYPPLAFSTLAIAKLIRDGVASLDELRGGLKVAADQLLSRFEAQAANQQVAGTAAVAVIKKLAPDLVDSKLFEDLLDRTFALQHDEGWFPEYDGPDLGYLTVTMDCLWDLYDVTNDERCVHSINGAMKYIAWFVDEPPHRAGMHNSRNTDYLVPYAIARLAAQQGPLKETAIRVFHRLFEEADHPDHFFAAVDDRYWCHYIGHSVFRALAILNGSSALTQRASQGNELPFSQPGSGHARLNGRDCTALISARKGAIVIVSWQNGSEATDFGWIVRRDNKEWVSHWWSMDWSIELSQDRVKTKGAMVPHQEHTSSPLKHMILRAGSFVLGKRMIGLLKKLLIFKKASDGFGFERVVSFEGDILMIKDVFTGLNEADELIRAPRSSKRHVASADSWHREDAKPRIGSKLEETINREPGGAVVETRLRLA